tara:strand:- start:765 stop:1502 length:738 start_codon:yes stop_codon:yes gene_type:complete
MSKASIVELAGIKKEIETGCKGGNEHVVFDESLMRDLYAYTVINFLTIYDFVVFGGFVAAHVSGKPWKDIDLMLPTDNAACFDQVLKIVPFLRLSFGFKPMQIQLYESHAKKYARTFNLTINDNTLRHYIKIDIVPKTCHKRMIWLPVTVGKCLLMNDNIISLRNIPKYPQMLLPWKVADILEMLRNGNDVGLSFPTPSLSRNAAYRYYWWQRVRNLREMGYVVDNFLGATPQEPEKGSIGSSSE